MIVAAAVVPVRVGAVNVLFESVCEPVNVATVASIAISFAFAVIPVPPITLTVTVPLVPPPVNPVPAVTPSMSPAMDAHSIALPPELVFRT